MIRTDELEQGCMAKALPDEMTFVLLARDPVAPSVIRHWARHRVASGLNGWHDQKMHEALRCARTMDEQRPEIREYLGKRNEKLAYVLADAEEVYEEHRKLAHCVRDFLTILLAEEQNDEGQTFQPTRIQTCRSHLLEPLEFIVGKLKELSGYAAQS